MKLLLVLLSLLAISRAFPDLPGLDRYLAEGYQIEDDKFGCLHLSKLADDGLDHIIVFPKQGILSEKDHLEYVHQRMLAIQANPPNLTDAIIQCKPEDKPDFYKFLPYLVGYVKPGIVLTNFSSPCFSNNTVSLTILDNSTIQLVHTASAPVSLFCQDSYLYTTTQNFHLVDIFARGIHKYTFQNLSATQFDEMITDGVGIFRFCDKISHEVTDVLMTVALFLGGFGTDPWIPIFGSRPPPWVVEENIKFIKDATGYEWVKRPSDVVVALDEQLIQSGDFFAITRFDGLDQIIEYGAGSRAGHCTTALWINGDLFICESQGGWYWPRSGIQCNPYQNWIKWADNAGFQVTWLPLKQVYRDKFNASAAWEWVQGKLGLPYGYHNFLWGWIDTENNNFPPILSGALIAPAFSLIEHVANDAAIQVFTSGLNMRLNQGKENWTIPQIAEYLYINNRTFEELYAQPEQDSWVYYDGPSMVCSSFVAGLWRAGGLFDGLHIQVTEFLPKDIYQLTYIDPTPLVPENCKTVDPTNQYCQIMGQYRMTFPDISTVEPYSNMNEYCQSTPPLYDRIPAMC